MYAMKHINEHIVPISRFNKGEANKIFDEVSQDGFRYVVKNNRVKCILLSPEAYDELIDNLEDYYDAKMADERLAHSSGTVHSLKEVAARAGITLEELEAAPDVEIE